MINSEIIIDSVHSLESHLKALNKTWDKVYVLVDENTNENCWPALYANQDFFTSAEIIALEAGEQTKSIEVCYQVWGALIETEATRNSLIVNLGGGMITDLGGFIASTFKRGIDFIHVPTSLLGMVDASIGGKTGINFDGLKNQIGTFTNPLFTLIDQNFLETLPEREFASGLAEVIKYGLIIDKSIIDILNSDSWNDEIGTLIKTSVNIKKDVVASDFKEQGERKKLNFGHTVGHAFETNAEGGLLHGEAITIGMIVESHISYKKGFITELEYKEIRVLIDKFFGIDDVSAFDIDELLDLMKSDKKNTDKGINFTLLTGIGTSVINQYVSEEEIRKSIVEAFE